MRVVARRYRGKICCYEVWNDPDFSGPPKDPKKRGGFYTGSVADTVEMARIARQEVYAPSEPLPPGNKSRITREEAAAMTVRQIVLAAFAGLEKYFYYSWDGEIQGMVDAAGRPYPSRDAIVLQRWLLGARLDHWMIQDGRPTLCSGEKDANPFTIVWNPTTAALIEVPVPKGLCITGRQVAVPRWIGATQVAADIGNMLATPPAFYKFERISQ